MKEQLRTTKDKLIFWIDIQMRELAKQDLYKGGMNAGYAIAITLIKQKLEEVSSIDPRLRPAILVLTA